MSAESALLERTFPVGRFACTMTIPRPKAGSLIYMTAEWSPRVPRRLSAVELADYHAGCDSVLSEACRLLGSDFIVMAEA